MKFDVNAYKTGTWKFPPSNRGRSQPAPRQSDQEFSSTSKLRPNVCALCDHLATVPLKPLEEQRPSLAGRNANG